MKKTIFLICLYLLTNIKIEAQSLLERTRNRVKEKIEQRIEEKTDEAVDKGLDKTEDAIKKSGKKVKNKLPPPTQTKQPKRVTKKLTVRKPIKQKWNRTPNMILFRVIKYFTSKTFRRMPLVTFLHYGPPTVVAK